jgi:hypothetical protein
MTTYGPAAFRKAIEARAGREQQARQHAAGRLLAAIRAVDQDTRHIKSGCKLIKPALWKAVMAAAKGLQGG